MGRPRNCEEVMQDLQERHQPFLKNGWQPLEISDEAVLHRLVRPDDIDSNTGKPKSSSFDNFGLSILVESSDFLPLNISEEVDKSEIFVAAVALSAEYFRSQGYEVYHDPHPDPLGNSQHPNHAQVVCKKTQSKTKGMKETCLWSVLPPGQ